MNDESGMSINIVEVTWKGNLKRAFPDPNAYSAFMGNFSTATGSVTLVMMILGRFIFQKFGWTTAALVTPTVLALTGAFFFSLILFEGTFSPLLSFFGTTPLMAAVLIGAVQVTVVCFFFLIFFSQGNLDFFPRIYRPHAEYLLSLCLSK